MARVFVKHIKICDLTLIEINVIFEVPIYYKNYKQKKINKIKYKKKNTKKKLFTDRQTDERKTQNYSLEPHNKLKHFINMKKVKKSIY